MPLRWRGQTRSIAFVRQGDHLVSDSVELCGFVPMIGHEHAGELTGPLDDRGLVSLYWDDDQQVDVATLRGILGANKSEVWSGVSIGSGESFDGVWLRLTAVEPGTCRIAANREAIDSKLCTPAIPSRSPALADGGSIAYLTYRFAGDEGAELGAIGHGPNGTHLATRICDAIQTWNLDRDAQPTITAHPAAHPTGETAIVKPNSQLVIAYSSCQLDPEVEHA